jgi:hypothetical protein
VSKEGPPGHSPLSKFEWQCERDNATDFKGIVGKITSWHRPAIQQIAMDSASAKQTPALWVGPTRREERLTLPPEYALRNVPAIVMSPDMAETANPWYVNHGWHMCPEQDQWTSGSSKLISQRYILILQSHPRWVSPSVVSIYSIRPTCSSVNDSNNTVFNINNLNYIFSKGLFYTSVQCLQYEEVKWEISKRKKR